MLNGKTEEHIIVKEIPESFKAKYLSEGVLGKAYLTDSKEVFKEFKTNLNTTNSIECNDFYSGNSYYFNLKNLTTIQNHLFAFPTKLVYKDSRKDENIIGYLMPYINGVNMWNVDGNTKIDTLINHSDRFEKELYNLAFYKGVRVHDLHPENVLYSDDEGFRAVDTDTYDCYCLEEQYITYRENIREWGNLLFEMYLRIYPFENNELTNLHNLCIFSGKVKPSLIMKKALEEILKEYNNIVTLDDYQNGQELIKRKNKY